MLLSLFFDVQASLGGPYSDSAHGNSSYGVDRTSTGIYAKGNCAHCHEQHASIGGEEPDPTGGPENWLIFKTLYEDQANSFCFNCHDATASSKQVAMPSQYTYSYKFGGDTSLVCPSDIKDAFQFVIETGTPQSNCSVSTGSSHQLTDIRNFLKGKWGFGSTNVKVNPCSGCHNPHKAQRHNYPVGSKGTSPISLPTAHDGDWNVYGAETTERMDSHTYQAPYYYSSTTTYEPDGNTVSDGSNMPDYVAFCTDCHTPTYDTQMVSAQRNTFTSNFLGTYIRNPDWTDSPHGNADGDKTDSMKRLDPYQANRNYVLSCTDCHETHGSPNGLLIRQEVNGESTVTFTDWGSRSDWLTLCQRCHNVSSSHKGSDPCYICHTHYPSALEPF